MNKRLGWGYDTASELLLSTVKGTTSETDFICDINKISSNYAKLQKRYRGWATKFKSHEDVISWLRRNNIKEKDVEKCKRQNSFNLLSSNWNPITISILHKIASNDITRLEKEFGKFSQNFSQDDWAWYLLFFIHPVLHELYYFELHYPKGYYYRLAKRLRSHRLGLKSVKTYLGKEGTTVKDSHIKACCTTIFKHIHLHPTTITWENPKNQNIKEAILCLEMRGNCLSSDEMHVAMVLGKMATMNFKGWYGYAPCAINEGPIFILKKGKYHSDCLREIIKILQSDNPKQNIIRDKLKEYYKIEE